MKSFLLVFVSLKLLCYVCAQSVQATFYIESLCPDCREYITNQLFPTWSTEGFANIMNVTLVPYGNAKEIQVGNEWQFTCQHGAQECLGNILETCAIYLYPDQNVFLPFVHCVESSQDPIKSMAGCAQQFSINFTAVQTLANSTKGNALEHMMGLLTESLNPAHQYVPWVTINGIHSTDGEENLMAVICATYQGPNKPSACDKFSASFFNIV